MTIKIPCVPFTLHIGQAGENGFRPISIDWSAWLTEYPNGTLSIIIARPDGETYPSVVGITESPYTYTPTALDTEVAGNGSMEFVLSDADTIGKTLTFPIVINESLSAGATPTPVPTWMQSVFDASSEAVEAVNHYPYIGSNGNWFNWDVENEQFVDTGVFAGGLVDVSNQFTAEHLTYSTIKVYKIGGKLISLTLKGKNNSGVSMTNTYIGKLTNAIKPIEALSIPVNINGTLSTVSLNTSAPYLLIVSGNIPNNATVELTGIYAI